MSLRPVIFSKWGPIPSYPHTIHTPMVRCPEPGKPCYWVWQSVCKEGTLGTRQLPFCPPMFAELCQSSGSMLGSAWPSRAHNPQEVSTCAERAPKSSVPCRKGTGAWQESDPLSLESSLFPPFPRLQMFIEYLLSASLVNIFFLRPIFFLKYYDMLEKKSGEDPSLWSVNFVKYW